MKRHHSLALAIEVAARKRDPWLKRVQMAQKSLTFANDQLAQLTTYAAEKDQQWTQGAQQGISVQVMQHHFQFMARLQQAIALQRIALKGLEADLAKNQAMLRDAEVRVLALKHVLASKVAADAAQAGKREQKQTDEFASLLRLRLRNQQTQETQEIAA
jgi:flagellar protein FliJ